MQNHPHPQGATAVLKNVLNDLERKADFRADDPSVLSEDTARQPAQQDADKDQGATTTLGAVIDALDERAYGILFLLLALPCCIPFIYGLPQIVSLPILFLAGQMAMGRSAPWLPEKLRSREFPITPMKSTVNKAEKYLGWFEKLAKPRITGITEGVGLRIIGALMLIPSASIMVPLPLTNTIPGIAVAIMAIGFIERDGLLVFLGLLMGLIWVFLLVFAGAEAISTFKDMILSRL